MEPSLKPKCSVPFVFASIAIVGVDQKSVVQFDDSLSLGAEVERIFTCSRYLEVGVSNGRRFDRSSVTILDADRVLSAFSLVRFGTQGNSPS